MNKNEEKCSFFALFRASLAKEVRVNLACFVFLSELFLPLIPHFEKRKMKSEIWFLSFLFLIHISNISFRFSLIKARDAWEEKLLLEVETKQG